MTPERWQQIQGIFEHVCDKSPSHRRDYLSMVCEEDAELRTEVEELLEHHDAVEDTAWLSDQSKQAKQFLMAGDVIHGHRIERLLGQGGMGAVYLAEKSGRQCALKILPAWLLSDDAKRRFSCEAGALQKIRHPNMCALIEVFNTDSDEPVIALEYSAGRPLAELLGGSDVLPMDFALNVLKQLASVLACAHAEKIWHRDLKPENILIENGSIVRLIDFGIAKHADTKLTRTGMLIGTPNYMAPEQWQEHAMGAAVDIWALGVLFFRMLSGKLPFSGDNPFEKMRSILEKDLTVELDELARKYGRPVSGLIADMLVKDSGGRLGSCEELFLRINDLG